MILFCTGESPITQIIHPQKTQAPLHLSTQQLYHRSVAGQALVLSALEGQPSPAQLGHADVVPTLHIKFSHPPCPITPCSILSGLSLLPGVEHQEKGLQVPPRLPFQAGTLQAWLRWHQPSNGWCGHQQKWKVGQLSHHTFATRLHQNYGRSSLQLLACAACPGRANTILK